MFPFTMLNITNYERWGRLVKTWIATPTSRPGSVAELQRQLNDANCGSVPAGITDIYFHQYESPVVSHEIHFTLPAQRDIAAIEAYIETHPYPIPAFYPAEYHMNVPTDTSGKIRLNNERVGDYVVNQCG